MSRRRQSVAPESAHQWRPVVASHRARDVSEGAGVKLRRSLGTLEVGTRDPFLLLDEFRSENPEDVRSGFPWHPHRGQETVTYLIEGSVKHEDSLGNSGTIGPGDLQWMSAAGGIVHQEMPRLQGGHIWGFQLWVNMPARLKDTAPRYREVLAAQVPHIHTPSGALVRVLAGEVGGTVGPVQDVAVDPLYLDASLPPGSALQLALPPEHRVLAYLCDGVVLADDADGRPLSFTGPTLLDFGPGDGVALEGGEGGARVLILAALPLNEPVVWHGPFVMNTKQEIRQAYLDHSQGRLAWRPERTRTE